MIYTNKYGLPDSLVRAVQNDDYDKGDADFSATELLKPPQIGHLFRKHEEDISEDVADVIYRLLGSGIHNVLERAYEDSDAVLEQRFFADIVLANGEPSTISGAVDLREAGKIMDYKVTATYTIMRGDHEAWEQQLNIYDWLARMNGSHVNELEIIAILRDWKKSQRFKVNYPDQGVVTVPINQWSHTEQEDFIREKIAEHQEDPPRYCTSDETWSGIRCKDWCNVSPFCKQFRGTHR